MEMLAFPDIKMRGNNQIGKKGCRQKKGMSGKLANIDMSTRHVGNMSPTFPTKSDGVLVQTQNRTSRCLKSHASVSQLFSTKGTHSCIPGLKGEALFSKLQSFYGVSADHRLVRIHILICIIQIPTR
jgi:hypothetical protein